MKVYVNSQRLAELAGCGAGQHGLKQFGDFGYAQLHIGRLAMGDHMVECKIINLPILPGVYSLRFGVTAGKSARTVFYGENLLHFQVEGNIPITVRDGFFALDAHWALKDAEDSNSQDMAMARPLTP